MALASAVSRTSATGLDKKPVQLLTTEQDYRVKCNALRGFQNIELDSVKATVFNLVKDPNLHVAALAAN